MLHIWICEENKRMSFLISEFVKNTMVRCEEKFVIEMYYNASGVYDAFYIENKHPDIIIISLDISDREGFDIIDELVRLPFAVLTFFISNSKSDLKTCMFYSPFACIVKKSLASEMDYFLRKAILYIHNAHFGILSVICNRQKQSIKIECVMYMTSLNKNTEIYLSDGNKLSVRTSLKRIYEQIKESDFVYLSRTSIINLEYISNYNTESILMKDGYNFNCSKLGIKRLNACCN